MRINHDSWGTNYSVTHYSLQLINNLHWTMSSRIGGTASFCNIIIARQSLCHNYRQQQAAGMYSDCIIATLHIYIRLGKLRLLYVNIA